MAKVPRILMLPGYTQNASIFRGRMGAIRKAIGDKVDFVWLDPTHVVDMPTTNAAQFDSSASAAAAGPEDTPRAWWFAKREEGFRQYEQLEPTLSYLRRALIEKGPFDGVWGFSQGAACAAMLTSLVEDPSQHAIFSAPAGPGELWPPTPFKFSIIVSGFLPLDPTCKCLFDKKVTTPSLHVLGRGDTIVGEDRSLPLLDGFVNPRVEWHDGGHHTPSKQSWRRFFEAYVQAQGDVETIAAIRSPSGGASTPVEGGKL